MEYIIVGGAIFLVYMASVSNALKHFMGRSDDSDDYFNTGIGKKNDVDPTKFIRDFMQKDGNAGDMRMLGGPKMAPAKEAIVTLGGNASKINALPSNLTNGVDSIGKTVNKVY